MIYVKNYEGFSIRDEYLKSSPSDYYSKNAINYKNPHSERVIKALDFIIGKIDIGNFLDLGCGNGLVSEYLLSKGLDQFKGCDPYFYKIFSDKLKKECYNLSFEDISKNGIKDKFKTIICSYSIHLCDKSYLNNLLYNLSIISENLVIISPSKFPIINENYFKLNYKNIIDRTHIRIFKSNNI